MPAESILFPARMRMKHGRRKSMSRSSALATGGLGILLALALAGPAMAAPAVDEYGANLPTSKGQESQGGGIPQAHPEDLPPSVAKSLNRSPDAKKLKTLATAPQLGAPPRPDNGSPAGDADDSGNEGFVTAAAGTLGSPWILLLILGLGLGAGGAWWARRGSTA
jgi:hypothetical protein